MTARLAKPLTTITVVSPYLAREAMVARMTGALRALSTEKLADATQRAARYVVACIEPEAIHGLDSLALSYETIRREVLR